VFGSNCIEDLAIGKVILHIRITLMGAMPFQPVTDCHFCLRTAPAVHSYRIFAIYA